MSQENVEIVRAMYEAFARGDFSGWAELPNDFEFVASPELPDAGTYRGEAAIRWMTGWVESRGTRSRLRRSSMPAATRFWSQSSNGAAHAKAKRWWKAVGGL
jgi:ketosteroid isomerase-like protein